MSEPSDKVVTAANEVAETLDAKVFVYSGDIDQQGYARLLKSMQPSDQQPKRPNSILYLTTKGGHAKSAYQIARLLQYTSDKFYLCVPSFCKSAGTLIALGATEIYMTPGSELGPLDVQLTQRNEIGQRRSGMVVRTALDGLAEEAYKVFEQVMLKITLASEQSISFDVASGIAAKIAIGAMSPVYAQIDPEALGNDLRDLSIATAYGERLVAHGKNATRETVKQLVEEYPEHGFLIDMKEAAELFNVVKLVGPEVSALMFELGELVYGAKVPHFVRRLDRVPQPERDQTDDETRDQRTKGSGLARGRKTAGGGNRTGKQGRREPSGSAEGATSNSNRAS